MIETTNHIAWLEQRIAQARELQGRNRARLVETPDDFASRLSMRSWENHVADLQQELRQAKEAPRRAGLSAPEST